MEHPGAGYAHAQNPKPADVTRTAVRTASRRRQRRERAHIDSRHRFLSFVARYRATQVVTSICMAPGHSQQVSRRDGAYHQDHARTECFVMASPEDGSELLTLPSPLERGREKTCPLLAQDPLHSIRPTHDVTSSLHGTGLRLRAHGFLESVPSNPKVELRP
jgi:hypothetical protein